MNKTKGGVTIRTINGNKYYYYQWYENGKKRSKTITEEEYLNYKNITINKNAYINNSTLLTGDKLKNLVKQTADYRKRYCYKDVDDFVHSPLSNKVLILYGLRRSGKTTIIYQILNSFNDSEFSKAAYILCHDKYTLEELNILLDSIYKEGYKYVFIDEVTYIKDFIDGAQFLADVYGGLMHIVLSGTDSLGFAIAANNSLYDRSILIHTTYISYKEFSEVLGIDNIDKYIEYGGTMTIEGVDYHKKNAPIFYDEESALSYVDTAIVSNIQHSLDNYKDGRNFERLIDIKNKGQLTNVINRIIQDDNHRFLTEVINRTFKSSDFGSLKELLRKNKKYSYLSTYIDSLDENDIYQSLMDSLEIINYSSSIDKATLIDLKTYLKMLDVINEIDEINIENNTSNKKVIFTQPGLRYAQVKALVESLLNQDSMLSLPKPLLDFILQLTLNDVKGKILEDIVLLETSKRSDCEVFKIKFLTGEIDMAKYKEGTISLFEIKHSETIDKMQSRHLRNETYLSLIHNKYGSIIEKNVLYQGRELDDAGIKYCNVTKYLKDLL